MTARRTHLHGSGYALGLLLAVVGLGAWDAKANEVPRLTGVPAPDRIRAFDFGPPSQSLMPGWTPVSHETTYTPERGYGWGAGSGHPWEDAARATTFGGPLLQDFCEAGSYQFRVKVPPGEYAVRVFFENSGDGSEEQAMPSRRSIQINDQVVWQETRPDGPAHALFRFEHVEPVGVDLWDTYMASELARPAAFDAVAGANGLTLRFESDRVGGARVSALAVYPKGDQAADAWWREQVEAIARDFRRQAVCLDPPSTPWTLTPSWERYGFAAWPVRIEDTVTPATQPPDTIPGPAELALSRTAVRGEFEPFCLAIRPHRDLGTCELSIEPLRGPQILDASVAVVYYGMRRNHGELAYRILPHTLRYQPILNLNQDVTRQIVVTARVPGDAIPGEYVSRLAIMDTQGRTFFQIPLRLDVRPVTLSRETDFSMGFFGIMPPGLIPPNETDQRLEDTLSLLREHGLNAVAGGPSWRLTGWLDGRPAIDFADTDAFFDRLRTNGFTRAVNGYGGLRFIGLDNGGEKDDGAAEVEHASGLSYPRAFPRAWEAVDAHARDKHWPLILYAMDVETQTRDPAAREREFMRLMGRVSKTFPQTVRTIGHFRISSDRRPAGTDDLPRAQRRFFKALDISALNDLDAGILEEAERRQREVHLYHQGVSRYHFGLYAWSAFSRGVRAHWESHLNLLYGYQFFDLDGRDPDTAMIAYGRRTIYPTIDLERSREGAEDFYLLQTLARLIAQRRAEGAPSPAVTEAEDLLTELTAGIALNQREPPPNFDADAIKRRLIQAAENLAAGD